MILDNNYSFKSNKINILFQKLTNKTRLRNPNNSVRLFSKFFDIEGINDTVLKHL